MPEYSDEMDLVFHALADGTRRAMVERLARGPASVSQLAEPFAMALQSAAQHIGVLETAGIVTLDESRPRAHCSTRRRPP